MCFGYAAHSAQQWVKPSNVRAMSLPDGIGTFAVAAKVRLCTECSQRDWTRSAGAAGWHMQWGHCIARNPHSQKDLNVHRVVRKDKVRHFKIRSEGRNPVILDIGLEWTLSDITVEKGRNLFYTEGREAFCIPKGYGTSGRHDLLAWQRVFLRFGNSYLTKQKFLPAHCESRLIPDTRVNSGH